MKYALALAGGGTRGAFETGVWRALNELGIEISAVAGTSIGAVNGALFAMGVQADTLWENIKVTDIVDVPENNENLLSVSSLVSFAKKGMDGGLDTAPFKRLLSSLIDEEKLRSSDIDYGLCTFSSTHKKTVELFKNEIERGKIVDYILASACFPVFKPVVIDGVEYTDGGLRNNLPADMLIRRGYDTIISVSVKGIGYVRDIDRCGVNIIEINCSSPEVGIMEFKSEAIKRSMQSGYLECMKTFKRLEGKIFYMDRDSYIEAVSVFGTAIVNGLEEAARILKLDRCRIYSFKELADLVLTGYKSSTSLKFLTGFINGNGSGFLREKLDLLGESFNAANSIVYLGKKLT